MEYPKAVIKNKEQGEEVFEVDMDKVCEVEGFAMVDSICSRTNGEFKGKGIWLNGNYDWKIVRDSLDNLVLLKLECEY